MKEKKNELCEVLKKRAWEKKDVIRKKVWNNKKSEGNWTKALIENEKNKKYKH